VARTELTDVDGANEPFVDVRQRSEYDSGHVPNARHAELGAIASGTVPVPPGATVMCGHGERAMSAASLLERRRPDARLRVLVGGPDEWSAAHHTPLRRA
jgi:rhodanese-related sulfurtransferase